jgi:site-specific DNA-methyltransferase (adenine-specific)
MWEQFRRVTKLRAAIVLTASQPFTSKLIMSNPHMFKYEWIWVKTKASDHINAKNKPMRRHENVLVFSNGTTANKSLNRMPYNPQGTVAISEWTYRPNRDVGLSHILGTRPSHKKGWIQELTNYPSSVLNFANPNNDLLHPTQKPVALFEYLIRTYTQAGDVVLDCCVGSGTTCIAARNTGRHFLACDSSPEYVELANKRLAKPWQPALLEG